MQDMCEFWRTIDEVDTLANGVSSLTRIKGWETWTTLQGFEAVSRPTQRSGLLGKFLAEIEKVVLQSRRKIVKQHYIPQPPDSPIRRAEPAYLKTVWLQLA